jgi:long-chain acyl-CoA synthetase
MTHPFIHARSHPDKIAYRMAGTDEAITYRELDELSNQGAQLFRTLNLKAGDHIALLMENRLAFMEICWAAQRAGLYYTAISRYLTQDEITYIVSDCGAKVVITSPKCAEQIKGLVTGASDGPAIFMLDEPLPGFRSWNNEAGSIRPGRLVVRRASKSRLRATGSTRRLPSCWEFAASCAAWTETASICHRPRSIMQRLYASTWRRSRLGARRS